MVVDSISGEKFIPWEAYRNLYLIKHEYLEQQGIEESLRDRYLSLRKELETEYTALLSDPNSSFYNPSVMKEDYSVLTNPNQDGTEIPTRLPDPFGLTNPQDIHKARKLLNDCRFVRSLRKIAELKATLDHRQELLWKIQQEHPDAPLSAVKTDLIYAQSVVQLDGDVINRYSQEILDHPYKEVILKIHREGVEASDRQWRGLLRFVIDLVEKAVGKGKRGLFSSGR
ncbi:MAG: hypothetical protein ACOC0N_02625 [Chroococcales cyanobacterium]